MRRSFPAICLFIALLLLPGCRPRRTPDADPAESEAGIPAHLRDYGGWADGEYYTLQLNGDSVITNATGLETATGRLTITEAGAYLVTGRLDDAQLVVDTPGEGVVELVLSGVSLHREHGPAIETRNAGLTVIYLAEDTDNRVGDGDGSAPAPGGAGSGAAVYADGALLITGPGRLEVTGRYRDAVVAKKLLTVSGGELDLLAFRNGVLGNGGIVVAGGSVSVACGGNGIEAGDAPGKPESGGITLQGGALEIRSGRDGLRSSGGVRIDGGSLRIRTGICPAAFADSEPEPETDPETGDPAVPGGKGILAARSIAVSGGTADIVSPDGGLRTDGNCSLTGGELTVETEGEGVRASRLIRMTGGSLRLRAGTGLSGGVIEIGGGVLDLRSAGNGLSAGFPGDPAEKTDGRILISGGSLHVCSGECGIGASGSAEISGGSLVVESPNGSLCGAPGAGGTFRVTGGTVLALGGREKSGGFDPESAQKFIRQNLCGNPGTRLEVLGEDGAGLVRTQSAYGFSSLLFSSPELQQAKSCTVRLNDSPYRIPIA